MSNERERLAREWAEDCQGEGKLPAYGIAAQAAAEHILATTTPPTMQGVQWEHEKHHLAGATTPAGHDAVMMWHDVDETGHIITDLGEWRPDQLTPNGKRYELVEVGAPEEPEHPETLTTVEDYRTAPAGTISVDLNGYPWLKVNSAIWESRSLEFSPQTMFMHGPHSVLRWGWGE